MWCTAGTWRPGKIDDTMCQKIFKTAFEIVHALTFRCIYFIHAGLALFMVRDLVDKHSRLGIYRYVCYVLYALRISWGDFGTLTIIRSRDTSWFLSVPVEAILHILVFNKRVSKWWSPATLIYIVSIVPSLVLLEIQKHDSLAVNSWYQTKNCCVSDIGMCGLGNLLRTK